MNVLKDVLPALEGDSFCEQEELLIREALENWFKRNPHEPVEDADVFVKAVKSCLRELDYYTPRSRAQIVDAAIAEVAGPAEKIKRLKALAPEIKAVFHGLDRRTKEILTVFSELSFIDGYINTNYCNELSKSIEVEVSFLRDNSALSPAVRAFDKAVAIKKAYD